MQITPQTPLEAWMQLSKMREMFRRMRDERIMHPSVGLDTREFVGDYYSSMMEAIDIGMSAILIHHRLKPAPNLLTQQLADVGR
jgi:hypothetical protein